MMAVLETMYLLATVALVGVGLTLVGLAVRAYQQTERRAMIHLSVGFALVVTAAATTAVGALATDFANVRSLLLANTGISTVGYIFIVYSIVRY